jgi:EmrB/QacA subfamily drug resistance transporter
MTTDTAQPPPAALQDRTDQPAPPSGSSGKWWSLVVLAMAQLMVVLDATIVNIALPTAQRDLGFSDSGRQWVVTGYALAFGSLLLLGGRLSDYVGRKKMFLIGLIGFALASALGGFAPNLEMLIVARALQGAFGAALAPAALSLLSTTFTTPGERAKAFGVFGAISGAGGAVGLLLGGVLTEYASWRWCLYVNLIIAAIAVAGALTRLKDDPITSRAKLDVPGAIAAVAGLVGLVYGLGKAETDGWTSAYTLVPIILGALVLIGFVMIEMRVANPLLPLRVVLDRNRGGAYAAIGISGAGMFGIFLFLTFYLTKIQHFTPIQTGLAFLPMLGAIVLSATTAGSILTPRVGPRPLVPVGALVAAGGMVFLTRLDVHSTYASGVLPALLLIGLGLGLVFAPTQNAATSGVQSRDAGVASAMINTVQQIGGSIGTALLSSFAATAGEHYARGKAPSPSLAVEAALHSYHTVFWWSAGFFIVASVISAVVFRTGPLSVDPDAPRAMAH